MRSIHLPLFREVLCGVHPLLYGIHTECLYAFCVYIRVLHAETSILERQLWMHVFIVNVALFFFNFILQIYSTIAPNGCFEAFDCLIFGLFFW